MKASSVFLSCSASLWCLFDPEDAGSVRAPQAARDRHGRADHRKRLGAATGAMLDRELLGHGRSRIIEDCYALDLVTSGGACWGAVAAHPSKGLQWIRARRTILATGGLGQIYRETTNPSVATGDGVAMAWRAGAELMDMEFMQFHPTTLYLAGASRALISEAVRGAGAKLRDRRGRAFMKDYHANAELAPRDVVSRSILRHMLATH